MIHLSLLNWLQLAVCKRVLRGGLICLARAEAGRNAHGLGRSRRPHTRLVLLCIGLWKSGGSQRQYARNLGIDMFGLRKKRRRELYQIYVGT